MLTLRAHVLILLAVASFVAVASAERPVARPVNASGERPQIAWQQDIESAWNVMKREQRPLLLFVTTDECIHCLRMQSTLTDAKIVENVQASYVAVAAHERDIPNVTERLQIRVFPTTVLISPQAEVLDIISGYTDSNRLQTRLESASKRAKTTKPM